ncbi:MAG: sodium-independent anion transporter [Helicobacteraceae bacterium CG2_30_36_10]|nr:MAG: sodium-independent anion transporter [Helicobacteraceae bacterium CG2_30_36_10]
MNNVFMPKFFSLLKSGIRKEQVLSDIFAGIVVGIVALPLAIAFAVASGVSPEKGLVTAVVAGFIISVLGGSRVQIGGPTGAFIVIVFGIVQQYGIDGLIISTVMSGVFLIIFGLLRLGALLKYFPHPLVVGFTSGIALVIFSTQIKDALGLNVEKMPADFLDKWVLYFSNLNHISLNATLITLITILITVYSTKYIKKIPGSFIAIILITLVVELANIPVATIETFFGEIPSTIEFSLPNFHFSDLSLYIAPALTIALLGSIESLLSAVVSDGMISGKHRSNTELIAQGIANIVTPFFGGIPATGAIARTATNVKNGGRTPIAGITHAITLLLIIMFFGSYAKLIPMSVLAGILIVVAYNMSEWRSFVSILKGSPFDIIVLLATFFLTVLVDLTVAIQVGVVLSSLLFMKRMSDIAELPTQSEDDEIEDYSKLPADIHTYEISGPLFFGSAKRYAETIGEIGNNCKILIIRMRYVPFVDSTAIHNLEGLIEILHASGVTIVLSGVSSSVQKDFEKAGFSDLLGKTNILDSYDKALTHAKNILNKVD